MSPSARRRVVVAVVLLAAAVAMQDARPPRAGALTAAPITRVQVGAVAKTATAAVAPTLPAASTAGTLLVATLTSQKNTAFNLPSGWTRAAQAHQTNADAEILYYAGNPGGITSVTFTNTGGSSTAGQLSEWSGVAASPLDRTGSTTALAATSVAPATSQATTVAGELAVTSTAEYLVLASTATYTPGTGWTNLGSSGATSSSYHYTADYRTGVPIGVVSETITSSAIGALSAAVATFKPLTCTGGTLGLTPPSTVAFPAVTLNGTNQTATTSADLAASDMSGSAAGWNVQATSTTFTNGAGRTLPTSATTVTGGAATAVSGNCDLPTNSIPYPVTLPAGTTAPTAVKVYDAASGTGGGPLTVTLSFKLAVPASAYMGSYSSTWTFTIASGP